MKKFLSYLKIRRYSPRTETAYSSLVATFLRVLGTYDPKELTDDDLARYITKYYIEPGHSRSYQNQVVNAIKLYYKAEFNRNIGMVINLRPRAEKKLPNVLSAEEVKKNTQSFQKRKTSNHFLSLVCRWNAYK